MATEMFVLLSALLTFAHVLKLEHTVLTSLFHRYLCFDILLFSHVCVWERLFLGTNWEVSVWTGTGEILTLLECDTTVWGGQT